MKRALCAALSLLLTVACVGAGAQSAPPPMGAMPGGPGGMAGGQPESYAAVTRIHGDTQLEGGSYHSTCADENALLVTDGALTLKGAQVTRASQDSTGGDTASFYGVGAAILATGGQATVEDCAVTTDAAGGAGLFAYGAGAIYASNCDIVTSGDTSGGIHVAGGGTLYAKDLTVDTAGGSSAAIRSDRGGGTMAVDGGSYTSHGAGSPAVYVTADITATGANLAATNSEALCLEGRNSVRLYDCRLSGDMPDLPQNDNTWTVIVYQSMSGDAQAGKGSFEMVGGTLVSQNGGLFYTTNTQSEFVLTGVTIQAEGADYFLRCTGNRNARGWGESGSNGAACAFTAIAQQMPGDIIWDSISQLDLYALSGSALVGAVVDDESCAGRGGRGYCNLTIDKTSSWTVTGDSALTALCCEGPVKDADGRQVSILGTDGRVYVRGDSPYTVTVSAYGDGRA